MTPLPQYLKTSASSSTHSRPWFSLRPAIMIKNRYHLKTKAVALWQISGKRLNLLQMKLTSGSTLVLVLPRCWGVGDDISLQTLTTWETGIYIKMSCLHNNLFYLLNWKKTQLHDWVLLAASKGRVWTYFLLEHTVRWRFICFFFSIASPLNLLGNVTSPFLILPFVRPPVLCHPLLLALCLLFGWVLRSWLWGQKELAQPGPAQPAQHQVKCLWQPTTQLLTVIYHHRALDPAQRGRGGAQEGFALSTKTAFTSLTYQNQYIF